MPTVICLPIRPRSLNARVKPAYSHAISEAARSRHIGGLFEGPLYSRIIWFHKSSSSQGDIDNVAKRIHDALKAIVFSDDQAITHSLAIKVDASGNVEIVEDPDNVEAFLELSERLAANDVKDILYVEVGHQESTKIHLGRIVR
jgi:hypothetical protein